MTGSLNWIPIRGDCMWPSLRSGDQAEWVEGTLQVGSVVVARSDEGLRAHRVIALLDQSVLLRGDNSQRADDALPREAILGVVRRVRRGGRVLEGWDVGPTFLGRLRVRAKAFRERLGA